MHDMIVEMYDVFYAKHMAHLFVFIIGKRVETKEMRDEEAYDYGVVAVVLNAALQNELPPAVDVQETFIWNSASMLKFSFRKKYLKFLKDPDRKQLVEGISKKNHFLVHHPDQFEAMMSSSVCKKRRSIFVRDSSRCTSKFQRSTRRRMVDWSTKRTYI